MSESRREIEPFKWIWPRRKASAVSAEPGRDTKSEKGERTDTAVREAIQNAVDHAGGRPCKVDICYLSRGKSKKEEKVFKLLNEALFSNLHKVEDEKTEHLLLIRDYGDGIDKDCDAFIRVMFETYVEKTDEKKGGKLGGRGIGRTAYQHLSNRDASAMISWPQTEIEKPFVLGEANNATEIRKRDSREYLAESEANDSLFGNEAEKNDEWVRQNVHSEGTSKLTKAAKEILSGKDVGLFDTEHGCLIVIPLNEKQGTMRRLRQICIENFGMRVLNHNLVVEFFEGMKSVATLSTNDIEQVVKNQVFLPTTRVRGSNECEYYLSKGEYKKGRFNFNTGEQEKLQALKSKGEPFCFSIEVVAGDKEVGTTNSLGVLQVHYGDVRKQTGKLKYRVWRLGMSVVRSSRDYKTPVTLCIEDEKLSDLVYELESGTHTNISTRHIGDEKEVCEKYGVSLDELQNLSVLINQLPKLCSEVLDPQPEPGAYAVGQIPIKIVRERGEKPKPRPRPVQPIGPRASTGKFFYDREEKSAIVGLQRHIKLYTGNRITITIGIDLDGGTDRGGDNRGQLRNLLARTPAQGLKVITDEIKTKNKTRVLVLVCYADVYPEENLVLELTGLSSTLVYDIEAVLERGNGETIF